MGVLCLAQTICKTFAFEGTISDCFCLALNCRFIEWKCFFIKPAYDAAVRRTLWERLTKTNHKDVTYYKGLLKRYTEELLMALRCDFLEDVRVFVN